MITQTQLTRDGIVSWGDTDASGWIHFTAALRWVEETEHAVYRSLGVDPGSFPRRAAAAEYNAPFRAGMEYRVELHLERLGRTSLTWSWEIFMVGSPEPAITGKFTVVHMGADGRPAELPAALVELQAEK